MLALHAYQGSTCGGCGGYLPETTQSEELVDYHADDPIRCLRCTAISLKAKDYHDSTAPEALRYPVERHVKGG